MLAALSSGSVSAQPQMIVEQEIVGSGMLADGSGDQVAYWMQVRNEGSTAAEVVKVLMRMPEEFADVHWTCEGVGAACGSGQGAGDILFQDVDLPPGAELTFELTTRIVDPRQRGIEAAIEALAAWPEVTGAAAVTFYSRCSASTSVDSPEAALPAHPCTFRDSFEARN